MIVFSQAFDLCNKTNRKFYLFYSQNSSITPRRTSNIELRTSNFERRLRSGNVEIRSSNSNAPPHSTLLRLQDHRSDPTPSAFKVQRSTFKVQRSTFFPAGFPHLKTYFDPHGSKWLRRSHRKPNAPDVSKGYLYPSPSPDSPYSGTQTALLIAWLIPVA